MRLLMESRLIVFLALLTVKSATSQFADSAEGYSYLQQPEGLLSVKKHGDSLLEAKLSSESSSNLTNPMWAASGACYGCAPNQCTQKLSDKVSDRNKYYCKLCNPGWLRLKHNRPAIGTQSFKVDFHCAEIDIKDPLERSIYMLRHGQSKWNAATEEDVTNHAIGGRDEWIDSPLSILGVRQARQTARWLLGSIGGDRRGMRLPKGWNLPAGPVFCPPLLIQLGTLNEFAKNNDFTDLSIIIAEASAIIKGGGAHDCHALTIELQKDDLVGQEAKILSWIVSQQGWHASQQEHIMPSDIEVIGPEPGATAEDLEVLQGLHCDVTSMASSMLVRAMDTLQIAMLQFRQNCPVYRVPWTISEHLQELDSNKDCEPRTAPRDRPSVVGVPKTEYDSTGILWDYLKAAYAASDVLAYNSFLNSSARNIKEAAVSSKLYKEVCGTTCRTMLKLQLDHAVASTTRHTSISTTKRHIIWGGHSIWFRQFFAERSDQDNQVCSFLASKKMANTAIVAAKVHKMKKPLGHETAEDYYAVTECRFVYLGFDSDVTFRDTEQKKVPTDLGEHRSLWQRVQSRFRRQQQEVLERNADVSRSSGSRAADQGYSDGVSVKETHNHRLL